MADDVWTTPVAASDPLIPCHRLTFLFFTNMSGIHFPTQSEYHFENSSGTRFSEGDGSSNEVQRTMLELINQLDGFDARGNIKVLMATNRLV